LKDLKPCPFCGSINLEIECAGSQHYVKCNECDTLGPCDARAGDPWNELDFAERVWNRRVNYNFKNDRSLY